MLHSIGTCLWFDGKAKEAAYYYKEVFVDVEIVSENPMAVVYNLFGRINLVLMRQFLLL